MSYVTFSDIILYMYMCTHTVIIIVMKLSIGNTKGNFSGH